jgi:phosphoglycerol transferase
MEAASRTALRRLHLGPLALDLGRLRGALEATAPALLALGLAALVLELWRARLSVPFEYSSNDANYQLMLVKGVLEHGWWFVNGSLGAPAGQQLYDFAVGADNLQILLVKALGTVSSDPAVVANLFYLASFPLCALTAFWVLRWAGIGRGPAVVCSVLYSLLPYHFGRGEHHAFLAAYYAVPPGCYLALAVAWRRPLFERRPGGGRLARLASRRSLITVASCVAVASTGTIYYSAFTVLLVAAAAAIGFAVLPRRATLATGGAVIALIGVVLAINLAPTYVYSLAHGRNPVVARRQARESEVLGLKLAQLVLPNDRHRVAGLAGVSDRYMRSAPPGTPLESYDASLGFIGAGGLLWLLGIAAARCLPGGRRRRATRVPDAAAALTVVAVLVGTVGGLSVVFAYVLSPQLRAWNRISIFIGFLAFLAVAYLLDRLARRLGAGRAGRAGFAAILIGVLAFGVLDQTSPGFTPAYEALAAHYRADARFVATVERRLPRRAEVFQLPYVEFPESAMVNAERNYDPLVGYLHSRRLRWSYGAMKGRPADWPAATTTLRLGEVLPGVAAAGFDGVYVDHYGYAQPGRTVDPALRRVLGVRAFDGSRGRIAFSDLRAYRRALGRRYTPAQLADLRSATLAPTSIAALSGAEGRPERSSTGDVTWWVTARHARLALVDPARRPRTILFVATLRTGPGRRGTIALRYPDGSAAVVPATERGVVVHRRLALHPGANPISLTTTGAPIPDGPGRHLLVQVLDPRFVAGPLVPFERACLASRHPPPECGR